MEFLIIVALSYLVGSIPTAYIIGKAKGIDIRNYGSGNVGATNVFRVLGYRLGIITFIIDMLKGFIPTYIVGRIYSNPYIIIITSSAVVLGHIFSIFLNFRGGKGVATSTGVFLYIATTQIIIAAGVFFIAVRIWGFVSLATLISTLVFTITSLLSNLKVEFKYFVIITAIIIFSTHISNIKRLLKGEELKYTIR